VICFVAVYLSNQNNMQLFQLDIGIWIGWIFCHSCCLVVHLLAFVLLVALLDSTGGVTSVLKYCQSLSIFSLLLLFDYYRLQSW